MKTEFLNYYKKEFKNITDEINLFSKKYSEIIKNDNENSFHYFNNNLIEAFSFLTAKTNLAIKDNDHSLCHTLLQTLYPHYLSSIPSSSIAEIKTNNTLTESFFIKKGTLISTTGKKNKKYYFSTAYPITIHPVLLKECSMIENQNHSKLSIQLESPHSFKTLASQNFNHLRFYIDCSTENADKLQTLLYNHLKKITLSNNDETDVLSEMLVTPVGFDEEDALLPFSHKTEASLILLIEYLLFPKKFYFFDLHSFSDSLINWDDNTLKITLHFDKNLSLSSTLNTHFLKLHCTPIINLFKKTSEPIKLHHHESSYPVYPNHDEKEESCEIEKILNLHIKSHEKITRATEFYQQHYGEDAPTHYFPKQPSLTNVEKQSTFSVSFSNLNLDLNTNLPSIASAEILCSNTDTTELTSSINEDFLLEEIVSSNIQKIQLLTPITSKHKWIQHTQDYWHYLSLLNFNLHLSSQNKIDLTDPFKKIIFMHTIINNEIQQQFLPSFISLRCEPTFTRHPKNPLFISRELSFTLTVNNHHLKNKNPFLLGTILKRFLTLYAPINHSVKLIILDTENNCLF